MIEFTIPIGIVKREYTKMLPLDQTKQYVHNHRNSVLEVRRSPEGIKITSEDFMCPICGSRIIRPSVSNPGSAYFKKKQQAERKVLDRLCDPQEMLGEPEFLVLHEKKEEGEKLVCPFCESRNSVSSQKRICRIKTGERSIKVYIQIRDFTELLEMQELVSQDEFVMPELLFATVSFDWGANRISLGVSDGQVDMVEKELKDPRNLGKHSMIRSSFDSIAFVRKFKRVFKQMYPCALPFADCFLNLEKYVLLTKFVGYNAAFYDAVPFAKDSEQDTWIGEDLEAIHDAGNVPAYLASTGLPVTKSVKRAVFAQPEILFFTPELLRIWNIYQNIDYFTRTLQSTHLFSVLSRLHSFEGIADFFQTIAAIKGKGWFCKVFSNWYNTEQLISEGFQYAAMGQEGKLRYLESIKISKNWPTEHIELIERSSRPVRAGRGCPENCKINGFFFKFLSSTGEMHSVGEELHNCLTGYTENNPPVYGVYKGSRVLAAIELNANRIIQARLSYNRDIKENKLVFAAYQKWVQRYGLKIRL